MPDRYIPAPATQYALEAGPILLKDGRIALLRPVSAADRGLLVEFLSRLSPESRTLRFFSEIEPSVAADLLLKPTPGEDKVMLLVLSGDPERIIATGEYVQEGIGSTSAEVAFLVDDWFQGKGLGSLLLERLALIAARRGIKRFHAFTLSENRSMLDVFKASGYSIESHREGGEVEVSFEIEPSAEMVSRFELRERVATVASLSPFFRPKGIAVVGASRNPESAGHRVLQNLVQNRFDGPVFPVNPAVAQNGEASVVGSILAYPSVKAVPGPVDMALITTPADQVIGVAEACGQRGIRALVVLTIGMSEAQIKGLLETCRHYGMRLLGPGSLGLVHTHPDVRLAASLAPMPPAGKIALSSQSGALGLAVLEYAREMGLGISSFVSLGAKADVSSNDLLQFWEDDPETGLVVMYVESFGNPRRFARLARRVGRKKPILAVRPGRDPVVEALFQQAGVLRAESLEEMFDVAALLAYQPLPKGNKVALVSNASGPGSIAVEVLKAAGLEVTHLDLGFTAKPEDYRGAAREVLENPSYDSVIGLFVPLHAGQTEAVAAVLYEALQETRAKGIHKTVLACLMSGGQRWRVRIGSEQIPVYRFPESAAKALSLTVQHARWLAEPLGEIPDHAIDEEAARKVVSGGKGQWLEKGEVDQLLKSFGIQAGKQQGLELLLCVQTDPLFGPVLSLQVPGIPLGLERTLARRITPLTDLDAKQIAVRAGAQNAVLEDLLLRVSRLVEELPEVAEVEMKVWNEGGLGEARVRVT